MDSVANIRLLAWLLQGSLSHLVNCRNSLINCRPVSFNENLHIADYVLIILFSFAEREPGKASSHFHLIEHGSYCSVDMRRTFKAYIAFIVC